VNDDQKPQRDVHDRFDRDCHARVTDRHQCGSQGDGVAQTQQPVGQQSSDHGRGIHQRAVRAVDSVGLVIREDELLGQIENQQRPHSVVAEALPQFDHEEIEQRPRVVPALACDHTGGPDQDESPGRQHDDQ
jgi:hypothetical protein